MTYKKSVIWTDLKINPGSAKNTEASDEIYTTLGIKKVYDVMENYMAQMQYIPVKMSFSSLENVDVSNLDSYSDEQEEGGKQSQFS